MLKHRFVFLAFLLGSIFFAIPASAQDDKEPVTINLDGATGSVGIQRELQTTAEVELVVGGQIYRLSVPVTVQIDASAVLTDATLTAPTAQQVGMISFEPTAMEKVEGEYQKDYTTVTPSADNVLVIYRADVTNLDDTAFDARYTSALKATAIDDVGNVYEEEQRICSQANPGEKVSCEFIFEVPATANLVDLEISTAAYKQFSFAGLETAE